VSDERAKAALEVFEAALALPPDERLSWIEAECNDDGDLAAEVKSLLSAHAESDNFLDCSRTDLGRTNLGDGRITGRDGAKIAWREIVPGGQIGDFRIERQIGAGGMGLVYRARQVSLNRPVALKVLPNHLHSSESARTRFQREIEAAARLHHRNIVAVYTTGEERGTVYYAMELIDGPALNQVIEELTRRPLGEVRGCLPITRRGYQSGGSTRPLAGDLTPPPDGTPTDSVDLSLFAAEGDYFVAVARLIADVASGLEYSHQMQVIHRDVKPSNLLLSKDGRILISDFGLARLSEEPGLTRTGDVLGTPFYMAPEQISSAVGTIDERTDVHALGATLYELLTLRPPFVGENREQVISKILHCESVAPRTINRLVPRDLETICLKALEKQPDRRYRSAGAMAEDLRRFAEGRPITARRAGMAERGAKWVGRHRAWSAAVAAMCLLAVVASFYVVRTYRAEARWNDAEFSRIFEEAQLAAMQGNLDQAVAAIKHANELGAPAAQLALLRGQVALQDGRWQDACDALELAARDLPDSLAAYALLVKAYTANQQRDKSHRAAEHLKQLKPSTLQDYLLLGEAQVYDRLEESQGTLDEAVRQHKDSVVARLTRGTSLIHQATTSSDAKIAEAALDDLRIASELIEPNPLLLRRLIEAHLVAATAYEAAKEPAQRQQHLDQAAKAADALQAFPDNYQANLWRAVYFDYVGDDESALECWRAIQNDTITFYVLTLYRLGRFPEALALCDERIARHPGARISEALRGFVLAATADTPESMLKSFGPPGNETLDPSNRLWFTYLTNCLAGKLDHAQAASRAMRESVMELSADEEERWRDTIKYCCGELDDDALLASQSDSRYERCQTHFVIGITRLAQGDRVGARKHLSAAGATRLMQSVSTSMSRALVAQLDRDPDWPPWIAAGPVETVASESK
jgi:serine/threonine protein kinase